jgi:hypothetical protein
VGTCAHCGEELHRGDMFFTPMTGKLLCLAGWQAPVEPIVSFEDPAGELIWSGDFPE